MKLIITLLFVFFSASGPSTSLAGRDPTHIRVAFEPDLAPMNFTAEGQAEGFAIDLLRAIAKNRNLSIEFIPMTKDEALKQIAVREIDVIAGISFSREHSETIEFTDPCYTSSIGILVSLEDRGVMALTDLSGALVALQSQTVEYEFLKNIRRIRYQVSNSQLTALRFFIAGRADVFVGNLATAKYYLHQYGLESRYEFSNTYLMPVDYSFGVQKEDYRLLNILNDGVRHLKSSGVYSDFYRKWFDQETEERAGLLRLVWKVGFGVISFFLIILFLGVRWNRQLKREVSRKTKDLRHLNESLCEQIELTQNNNEFLKQIIDSSPRGIITLDREGFITKINKIAFKILGKKESPPGIHYSRIPLVNELLEQKAEPVLTGRQKNYLGEYKECKYDGERTHQLRYYVYPLYKYDQQINGIILTFEDVTAELEIRKKMFEQEKNRALSRMVAGIAHEIRNPLSSIKTFVELIPRKIHNEKFQREITACVPKEIVRINRLIEGLISYAPPRRMKVAQVSVKNLLDECKLLFEHGVRSKGFHLHCEAPEDLQIMVDRDQVKQVIINLIINAIDALAQVEKAPSSLAIELRAFRNGLHVCIQVVDNGVGMSEEEKLNALEPFFTTKPCGTGLGLPLADQLVRESNGELIIESREKAGTVVSMLFDPAKELLQHEKNSDSR